ncbi:MAG: hypothetical protein AB8B85_18485 [Paracoccaceae bacterium]
MNISFPAFMASLILLVAAFATGPAKAGSAQTLMQIEAHADVQTVGFRHKKQRAHHHRKGNKLVLRFRNGRVAIGKHYPRRARKGHWHNGYGYHRHGSKKHSHGHRHHDGKVYRQRGFKLIIR